MTAKRGGLGRGLGALIPNSPQPASGEPGHDTTGHDTTGQDAAAATDGVDTGQQDVPGTLAPVSESHDSPASGADGPDEPDAVPGARFAEIAVEEIHANTRQPRQVFDEDSLAELTHSIREFGVLQPVVVRADGDGYELVMGERRLRAATAAGLDVIPAIVRETADDAMLRDALLENVHRVQLNPLEEAAAYQQLLEEFGSTHEELAHRLGRSRPQITNTVRLLSLPVPVQRRVAAGVLSAGHARALLSLDDRNAQDELAGRIVAEGLSVRATEELVALAASGHGERASRRRTPARHISAPAITDLADRLSDVFETRVRVDLGRRKGKITVEFASVDDLERIVAVMAPSVAATRRVQPDAAEPAEGSGDDGAGSANVP